MVKSKAGLVKGMIDNTSNFDDELEISDDVSLDSTNFLNDDIKTHQKVKSTLVGNLVELAKNTSKVVYKLPMT